MLAMLVARNEADLATTAEAVNEVEGVTARCLAADLATVDEMDALVESMVGAVKDALGNGDGGSLIVVHNAGSLGNLKYVDEFAGEGMVTTISSTMSLNMSSPIALTGALLADGGIASLFTNVVVVNISSLLAVQAFPCWGLYAAHKAGRDMFFKVLATEVEHIKAERGMGLVRVLNYSPGPLDTAMQGEVRTAISDASQQQLFAGMKEEGKLVTVQASANKLMALLAGNAYDDGAHIDYYDELPAGGGNSSG